MSPLKDYLLLFLGKVVKNCIHRLGGIFVPSKMELEGRGFSLWKSNVLMNIQ